MIDARRIVRQRFGYDHHPLYRALARALVAVAWPLAVLVHLWQIRRERGRNAVPMKRVPGALWTALRHNVLPGEYYAYRLWEEHRQRNIDLYLYCNEGARLFRVLNRPSPMDPIGDKWAFNEMCKTHAIPSPEILAAFTPTGKLREFESGRAPERDLFIKPRTGLGGDGAERLRWQHTAFESNDTRRLRSEDLDGYLATRARTENRTLLVQPALANHPMLRVGANGELATVRLVTGLSPDGDVIPIFGFIHFARSNQTTAQDGPVALIDMATGRLMPATHSPSGPQHLDHKPNNRWEDICTLPDWDMALRHTEVAHRACSNFVFVGWDVVFTEHGPMLLEGNANWCADEYQRLRGEPLGYTKFSEVLEARLRDLDHLRDHSSVQEGSYTSSRY